MNNSHHIYRLMMLLTFLLCSCNLPAAQSGAPDLQATITAQALLLQGPGNQPAPPEAGGNTPVPSLTPTITPTFTPSVPTATVSQDTNCRSGPSKDYDYLGILHVGESVEVIGKNTATNYWIIKLGGVACWLWGQYATVGGNVAALPEYDIPATPTPLPTATPAAPKPVTNLTANKICIPLVLPTYMYNGTITWEDKSNNETGFHIYFNGGLFGIVGPNVTSYPIPAIPFAAGTPIKMSVESFNDTGASVKKEVTIICP